jgi:TonB family protein
MKKLIILFYCLFFTATFVAAQTPPPNWRTFEPRLRDFSVEAPVALTSDENDPTGDSRNYWGRFEGVYLYVFADKIGANQPSGDTALRFARNHQKTGSPATVDGRDAQEFVFKNEDDYYHRVVCLEWGGKRYIFQAFSENRSDPLIDRFFASIKIKKDISGTAPTDAPVDRDAALPPSVGGTVSGSGSGSGLGKGSGNGGGMEGPGIGSGRGGGTGVRTEGSSAGSAGEPSQTAKLKLVSKPRPSYTDLARYYNISGFVMLRVNFLADGTIGDVTPVQKLPFGLADMALAAARNIRFEPAKKDGIPYSVTSTIQYSFTIY